MNNLFGTDGIRAPVGNAPLTLDSLSRCGNAVAQWAIQKYGAHPHILLSHDTRISAHWIIAALQAGMLLNPITLHTAEILPTPAVCKLIALNTQFNAGIIISASHNDATDNGIKIVDSTHGKLSAQEEHSITHYFNAPLAPSYTHYGTAQPYQTGPDEYIQHILSTYPPNFLSHLKIVIDCANGATYHTAPTIFKQLGAQVIPINNTPNGTNINANCGTLHMQGLQCAIASHTADIGFAFDGDGDRVLVATRHGTIKNGDDILALLSNHPRYKNESTIAGTVMANHGLDIYLRERGKSLIRTPVGDKHVSHYLETHNGLLGGEQSGHIILHDYMQTGDGVATALRILEQIIHTGDWTLSTFDPLPQILINLPVHTKKSLDDHIIAQLIDDHEKQLLAGRLVVRYSGTENVLRIMVEDKEEKNAKSVSSRLADALQKELQ